VDRGWIYAIAHVRGGSDKGWNWFLTARRMTKKNTDFIAAGEHLIARNYARAGHIVAEGRSAGGMLMGAINNMRPDLWAGVIGGVPFVDIINTMSDTSLPLTPPEWPEWGNPIEDPEAYDYMMSYSPYDQVGPRPIRRCWPPAACQIRVTYWEPENGVARPRPADLGPADPAEDQYGGRPRRVIGAVRLSEGSRARLRLCGLGHRQGLGAGLKPPAPVP
jgi:oligopeptidase B